MDDKNIVDFERAKIERQRMENFDQRMRELAEFDKTKISSEKYAQGVKILLNHAFRHPTTSSANVCASVLLSCYSGAEFHVNLSSIGIIDFDLYQAALAVIRGRVERGMEPHEMIDGGSDIFPRLCEEYRHLTVINRAKKSCDCCDGLGKFYKTDDDYQQGRGETCTECDGRGWSWPEK